MRTFAEIIPICVSSLIFILLEKIQQEQQNIKHAKKGLERFFENKRYIKVNQSVNKLKYL